MLNKSEILKKLIQEYDVKTTRDVQEMLKDLFSETIQEILEQAICEVTNENCTTYPSGRTDAGVHALGQVVNFFTSCNIPEDKFAIVLNQKFYFILESME